MATKAAKMETKAAKVEKAAKRAAKAAKKNSVLIKRKLEEVDEDDNVSDLTERSFSPLKLPKMGECPWIPRQDAGDLYNPGDNSPGSRVDCFSRLSTDSGIPPPKHSWLVLPLGDKNPVDFTSEDWGNALRDVKLLNSKGTDTDFPRDDCFTTGFPEEN